MLSHVREQVPTFQSRKDSILIETSFKTSPDPKSEEAISNLQDPRAESCRYFAIGKTVDSSILRPELRDSPGSLSTGGTPLQKMSKVVAPRNAKAVFRRHTSPKESLEEIDLSWPSFLLTISRDCPALCQNSNTSRSRHVVAVSEWGGDV
jgi:hypothetical protein